MRDIAPLNNNGSILLRFTYAGKRYSLNPVPQGRFDDKLAYARACEIALKVKQDCITGNFDPTLAKYKPHVHTVTVKQVLEPATDNPKLNAVNLLKLSIAGMPKTQKPRKRSWAYCHQCHCSKCGRPLHVSSERNVESQVQ